MHKTTLPIHDNTRRVQLTKASTADNEQETKSSESNTYIISSHILSSTQNILIIKTRNESKKTDLNTTDKNLTQEKFSTAPQTKIYNILDPQFSWEDIFVR